MKVFVGLKPAMDHYPALFAFSHTHAGTLSPSSSLCSLPLFLSATHTLTGFSTFLSSSPLFPNILHFVGPPLLSPPTHFIIIIFVFLLTILILIWIPAASSTLLHIQSPSFFRSLLSLSLAHTHRHTHIWKQSKRLHALGGGLPLALSLSLALFLTLSRYHCRAEPQRQQRQREERVLTPNQ